MWVSSKNLSTSVVSHIEAPSLKTHTCAEHFPSQVGTVGPWRGVVVGGWALVWLVREMTVPAMGSVCLQVPFLLNSRYAKSDNFFLQGNAGIQSEMNGRLCEQLLSIGPNLLDCGQ